MNLNTNKGRKHLERMEARRKKRIEARFPPLKTKQDVKVKK